jgi:hypothetical protein
MEQIDLNALADYMLGTVDCSEDYEDDAFGVEFRGERFYVERYSSHFYMEDRNGTVFEIPRH